MIWEYLKERMLYNTDSKIFDQTTQLTYYEFINEVIKTGSVLKEKMRRKSKCAILCDSNLNTAISILACWYAELIPIPMSKHYGEKHCKSIISVTNPNLLILDNKRDSGLSNITKFCLSDKKFYGEYKEGIYEPELDDVAAMMCTSGTTGNPKAVMLTEDGLMNNVKNIAKYFKISYIDTILIARPLYHCAVLSGEFLVSLVIGVNICFFDEAYNPAAIIKSLNEYKISVLCGTPTLIYHIAKYYRRLNLNPKLKVIAISGECLSKIVAQNIRNVFLDTNIYNVYGLTEASPRVSYLNPSMFDNFPESVGIPIGETEIKVVDTYFNQLPRNEVGDIIVRSKSIMKGYYKQPQLTLNTIQSGWLKTRDIGYVDENGLLYIVSRADDLIIKAGMNIYPKEIENSLRESNMVEDVVAYGVKNNIGQSIAVNVVLAEDYKSISEKELMYNISSLLPSFQIPNEVNVVQKLEKNASGKVIRPKR